jgi:hypothetical protein
MFINYQMFVEIIYRGPRWRHLEKEVPSSYVLDLLTNFTPCSKVLEPNNTYRIRMALQHGWVALGLKVVKMICNVRGIRLDVIM